MRKQGHLQLRGAYTIGAALSAIKCLQGNRDEAPRAGMPQINKGGEEEN